MAKKYSQETRARRVMLPDKCNAGRFCCPSRATSALLSSVPTPLPPAEPATERTRLLAALDRFERPLIAFAKSICHDLETSRDAVLTPSSVSPKTRRRAMSKASPPGSSPSAGTASSASSAKTNASSPWKP